MQSAIFSNCVPRNRCLGLTQAGVSQRCNTHCPVGISPTINNHDARCASLDDWDIQNCPYPLIRGPFHFQHSSRPRGTDTLHINLTNWAGEGGSTDGLLLIYSGNPIIEDMENLLFAPSALIFAASITTGAYFILFVFRAKRTSIHADNLPDIRLWKNGNQ